MSAGLDGARALVTGGASGIGLATVRALQAAGASVVALDRNRADAAEDLEVLEVDVSDAAGVADLLRRLTRLDILVNNAGIGAQGTVEDNPDDEWHRVFDVNVVGMVRVSRAVLPALRLSDRASIVNVCSVAANAGLPRRALYSATKGAVRALTLAMAADHLAEGIRVNSVSPGTAATPWVQRLLDQTEDPAAELTALEARQPHGRLVSADEVAAAVVYLAGPSAGSTTGIDLAVDGGMSGLRLPARPSSP